MKKNPYRSLLMWDLAMIALAWSIGVSFLTVGCQSIPSGSVDQVISAIEAQSTNALAQPVPVTSVESAPVPAPQSDVVIAAGAFARPAVAVGGDGRIFVAAEGSAMQSVHLYVGTSNHWAGGVIAKSTRGGLVNTSRVYVPDIVVDRDGWAFVSMRCGPKEWGVLHGPAIYVRAPNGSGQWRFLGLTKGAARIDIDGGNPGTVYLMSKDGAWGQLSRSATITRQGVFKAAGGTGEKFDLDIVGQRWYTAMNGCAEMSGAFGSGFENAGSRATWAAHAAFPQQGNDLCYLSVCSDLRHPGRVYIASVFGGRLYVQVMEDGAPRYPVDTLAALGEATLEDRCPPRLVSASNGVVVIWKKGNDIQAVNVDRALAGKAKPARICAGSFPAAAVDPAGRIAIAYVAGGALKFKTIEAL